MVKGNYCGITKEEEVQKYQEVRKIAENKLQATRDEVDNLAKELHELQEVYDLDEKEGLAQWFIKDNRFQDVRKELLRAERVKKKPYFGRIDFIDPEGDKKATYYIGKSVVYEDPAQPVVIDWRAPVSSVYYEQNLGKCRYRVPHEGAYEIELERKRTYEIDDEGVRDFYDSEVVANDELLTKYLSKSKRNVLSEIIATIQQEQNDVIRINPHHNVLIQGSAGSGKTTVAMHRISYILYNYEREFDPKDFYIVGSNKMLLNYITGVLPDLDVYDIPQMTMEELFVKLLYEEWDDKKYKIRKLDKTNQITGVKGQSAWFDELETFCEECMWKFVPTADIRLKENNHLLMSGDDIKKVLTDMKGRTIRDIYDKLKDILISRLESEMFGKGLSYSSEMQTRMYNFYGSYFERRAVKNTVWQLYDEFVKSRINKGVKCEYIPNEPDLYDLACLAFIYKRLKETEVIREACHVVIDEAQDFGITVYRSLKYSLSKCTFTIMGDVSQNVNMGCGLEDWEELKKVMLPQEYDYFGLLRKSYRNTIEISKFATDILKHGSFPIYPVEPIIRHGKEVDIIHGNETENCERIAQTILKWKDEYETIAIICGNQNEAEGLTRSLKENESVCNYVNLYSEDTVTFTDGVTILPIEFSKGLEFDAVVIANASEDIYPSEDGYAKLLYVAATRALHELVVFHTGKLTGLISDPIDENKINPVFEEDNFHKKALQMEDDNRTKSEIAVEQAQVGDSERKMRDHLGPKKIEPVKKPETGKVAVSVKTHIKSTSSKKVLINENRPSLVYGQQVETAKDVNYLRSGVFGIGGAKNSRISNRVAPKGSVYGQGIIRSEFGEAPQGLSLTPPGHGKIDHSVKWINQDNEKVVITSFYDNVAITPVTDDTVKVTVYKTEPVKKPVPKDIKSGTGLRWKCNQSRTSIDITTGKMTVSVDKMTGTVNFASSKTGKILSEGLKLSRQYVENTRSWYQYFAFQKKELLKAMDEDGSWIDVTGVARYVSHGPNSETPVIIMSMNGYRIVIPAGDKIMINSIQSYSPHILFEKAEVIEYYVQITK